MLGEGQSTELSLRCGTPRPLAVLGLMSDLTTLPADRLLGALPLHVPREVAVEAEAIFLRRTLQPEGRLLHPQELLTLTPHGLVQCPRLDPG
jgi:hypothetical protein